jgi:hypothetical protein
MLADGLLVLDRGHGPDPRVAFPSPQHASGLPPDELAVLQYGYACWPAGLHIGGGLDPCVLLGPLAGRAAPTLSPAVVAETLFEAMLLPRCIGPSAADRLWPAVESEVERFLRHLEQQTGVDGLARQARLALEDSVIRHSEGWESLVIGRTQAVRLELTAPLPDLHPGPSVERIRISATLEGSALPSVDLPVFDGVVSGKVIADAVAAKIAWNVLGLFLDRGVYANQITIRKELAGTSVWRGAVCLARGLGAAPEPASQSSWLHQEVGWTVFLQELWGRPHWVAADFYDPARRDEPATVRRVEGATASIEVSGAPVSLKASVDDLWVEIRVGGLPTGSVRVSTKAGRISAQQLRAAVTTAGGLELCRAAVREAILGQPLDQEGTLRERLAQAASRHA